jgi:hypothetical protein
MRYFLTITLLLLILTLYIIQDLYNVRKFNTHTSIKMNLLVV